MKRIRVMLPSLGDNPPDAIGLRLLQLTGLVEPIMDDTRHIHLGPSHKEATEPRD